MSNLYTLEKNQMTGRWSLFLLLVVLSPVSSAISAPSVEEAVNGLVSDALAANLELDGALAQTSQRLAALDQARALYLPSLDFNARYSRGSGGRTIDFPKSPPKRRRAGTAPEIRCTMPGWQRPSTRLRRIDPSPARKGTG